METERIALSQRERDRLKVLDEVKQRHLTQVEAAERLKVTDRHVRRLLVALRERGDGAVVHRLRGRPSNRKLATSFEQKILARIRQRYADFGPTLVAEHLAEEGCKVSRETLRKWMSGAKLWHPRAQRVKTMHVWRERRACFGELVMQDSSPFRWLEERAPACSLIAVIDDASSRLWARLGTILPKKTCARWEVGCNAMDDRWRITPINTASFAIAAGRRLCGNSFVEKKRSRNSDGPYGNWGSNGSRRTVRKPKDASRDSLGLCKTAW